MNEKEDVDPLLELQPALNPYRVAAGYALRRLRWDIRPIAWSSRAKLRKWHNRYLGQKAVIMCNGPSLLKVDFDMLRDSGMFTFGMNKINMLFDKTDFRPSCIVTQQELVIQQNAEFFNSTELPLFFADVGVRFIKNRPNVHFFHETHVRRFAQDVSWSLYGGHTVTFATLQIAFHMGFKEVALVGCDHNFAVKGPGSALATAKGPDLSHFDPNYFAHGSKWLLPDLFGSEVSYKMARDMYEARGRRVVNATEGGLLEIFDREPLTAFLRR